MRYATQRRSRSLFDRFFNYLDRRSPSDRFLLSLAAIAFIGSAGWLLIQTSHSYTETQPARGGTYVEGVIGTPRFVNPVLAITRADHDLVALVYSGLMKLSADGSLEPDLAESIDISDDGKVYHVRLKDGITFHDGTPVTTDDVAFTIGLIQDPELKSPLRGNWNGVSVEVINERELNFVLAEPYVPFIENFTVGIMPKHIWGELSMEELPFSQHNTDPIGTGPYQVADIVRSDSGLIKAYTLTAYAGNHRVPNIEFFVLNFYPNETALTAAFEKGEITGSASLPNEAVERTDPNQMQLLADPLPRVFAVFLNQNRSIVLRDPAVREALSVAVDRNDLIATVIDGFGEPAETPLPASFFTAATSSASTTPITNRRQAAADILSAAGWLQNEAGVWTKEIDEAETVLSISLATANTPVFKDTAEYLKQIWGELGISVDVELFEQSDLVQAVIRPREYEALLFGTDVGRHLDLYPFWHSSQRDDPGLNVALYTNIETDDLLQDIRVTQDEAKRAELIQQLVTTITTDTPAVFLFSPAFVYLVDAQVSVVPVARLASPSERFSTVAQWYMEEDKLWPIFHDITEH